MDEEHEAFLRLREALHGDRGTTEEARKRRREAYEGLRDASRRRARGGEEGRPPGKAKKAKKAKRAAGEEGAGRGGTGAAKREKELIGCASAGDLLGVQRHLREGAVPTCRDKAGCTPLHWAALYGHEHVAEELLAAAGRGGGGGEGAAVGAANSGGSTPLHYACLGRHPRLAALLVGRGADPYAANSSGQTPALLGLRGLQREVDAGARLDRLTNQRAAAAAAAAAVAWEMQERRGAEAAAPPDPAEAWAGYEEAWAGLMERAGDGAGGSLGPDDLPCPRLGGGGWAGPGGDGRPLLVVALRLSPRDLKRAVRREQLRWHPDKFTARFAAALRAAGPDVAARTMERVNAVAGELNAL